MAEAIIVQCVIDILDDSSTHCVRRPVCQSYPGARWYSVSMRLSATARYGLDVTVASERKTCRTMPDQIQSSIARRCNNGPYCRSLITSLVVYSTARTQWLGTTSPRSRFFALRLKADLENPESLRVLTSRRLNGKLGKPG